MSPNSNPSQSIYTVDCSNLFGLDQRPPFGSYITSLWKQKHFILADSKSKSLQSGSGTFFGKFWIIFSPALQIALYAFVFGVILQTNRGIDNYIGFLAIGVIFYRFLAGGLSGGTLLVQQSRNLIRSFPFPKAVLPISLSIRHMIDNAVPALLAVVAALLFQPDKQLSLSLVLVVPLFMLMSLFNLGLIMLVSWASAFVPDVKNLITLVTRILFYLSGVFYSIENAPVSHEIKTVMASNPFYQFLSSIRACVITGEPPSASQWSILALSTLGLLILGFLCYWKSEIRFNNV